MSEELKPCTCTEEMQRKAVGKACGKNATIAAAIGSKVQKPSRTPVPGWSSTAGSSRTAMSEEVEAFCETEGAQTRADSISKEERRA